LKNSETLSFYFGAQLFGVSGVVLFWQ